MAKGKLARCNEWMFQTVKCRAYMKKVKDGRFILHRSSKETMDQIESWSYAWMENGEPKEKQIPDEDCGGSDFIKTYYERTVKEFVGIVVGFELITVTAELYLDFYCDDYSERYFANRNPREQVKCAKVYYGCNKSRYVPLDDMVILKEEA